MNLRDYDQLSELNALFGNAQSIDTLWWLGIDVILLTIMSALLGWIYVRSAYSLSNRKRLAVLFPMLALTTMMVISFIQSSLALSLGLVGALSIVRFRSAIKEPEELIYIFLVIAMGLGFGAGQRVLAVVFFGIIFGFLALKLLLEGRFRFLSAYNHVLHYLDIATTGQDTPKLDATKLSETIKPYCHSLVLKRYDQQTTETRVMFELTLDSVQELDALISKIEKTFPKTSISVTQHEPLFA